MEGVFNNQSSPCLLYAETRWRQKSGKETKINYFAEKYSYLVENGYTSKISKTNLNNELEIDFNTVSSLHGRRNTIEQSSFLRMMRVSGLNSAVNIRVAMEIAPNELTVEFFSSA